MDCFIFWTEIKRKQNKPLDQLEIKKFIIFIEKIISKKPELLYSSSTYNLNKEFHCIPVSLKAGFELAISMEEALLAEEKPFTLQYAITWGSIEIPRRRNMFRGFVGSGLAHTDVWMQRLRDSHDKRFIVDTRDLRESDYFTKLFSLYQDLYDSWAVRDFKLVTNLIIFWDYNVVAKNLEKDRALVWKRRKSLNIGQYNTIKDLILKAPDLIAKKKL